MAIELISCHIHMCTRPKIIQVHSRFAMRIAECTNLLPIAQEK